MSPEQQVDRRSQKWSLYLIGAFVVAVAVPIGIGFLGSIFGGGDNDWYKSLDKPSWTPPSWAFPVVWTLLYLLMGIASFIVWRQGGFHAQAYPLGIYFLQLALNFAWTPIFFGWKRPDLALIEIILLWLSVAWTIFLFYHVKPAAAYLLIPYILWVTLATAMNAHIFKNNPVAGAYHDISTPLRGSA
ncbi:hypothetical protein R1sor_000901 [Riccia sorocarpa]|uniref:Tryptophan-rich sensory protein n=1 Tax=Riccia sorocarpa TaxID=122646 RepID=A0ABD3H0H0_9MARC